MAATVEVIGLIEKKELQAAYIQWYRAKRKVDFTLGLRGEFTDLTGEQRLINNVVIYLKYYRQNN